MVNLRLNYPSPRFRCTSTLKGGTSDQALFRPMTALCDILLHIYVLGVVYAG
jgi:hypothetical protein